MDIKKRLPHEVCYDAADKILKQRAEIERLRAALRAIIEEDYGLQSPHQKKMAEMAKQALNEQITKVERI